MSYPKLKFILCSLFVVTSVLTTACKDSEEETPVNTGGGGGGGDDTRPTYDFTGLSFDGTVEYVTVPRTWYTGDFTICTWIKPNDVTGGTLLSMSGSDKYFYLSFDSSTIYWHLESANDTDSQLNASFSMSTGQWYHVCVTADHDTADTSINNSRAAVFVNGVMRGSINMTLDGPALGSASVLTIGYEPVPSLQSPATAVPFNGVMDGMIIWDRELSSNAINQVYMSAETFDPRFAFGTYTSVHVSSLQAEYVFGDDQYDDLTGTSPLIKDTFNHSDGTPYYFESNDFVEIVW